MKKYLPYLIANTIIFVALFAVFFVVAEDNPDNPMSLTEFIVTKVVSLLVIYACYRAWRTADKHGLIPHIDDPDDTLE